MGTRAVIRFGNNRIATHWDGYPESLGQDLIDLEDKTLDNVLEIADQHTIDFISLDDSQKMESLRKKRMDSLVRKGRLIKKDGQYYHTSSMISAGDYPISSFTNYDDFAEFEYLVDGNTILYRELRGSYKEAMKKSGAFISLRDKLLEIENPSKRN